MHDENRDPQQGQGQYRDDEPENTTTEEGRLLDSSGTAPIVRVSTGEGDEARVTPGYLVVGSGGAVTFQPIENDDDEG